MVKTAVHSRRACRAVVCVVILFLVSGCATTQTAKDYDDDYEKIDPDEIHPLARLTDAGALISVKSASDVAAKRANLVRYIWKDEGFPRAAGPDEIERDNGDQRFLELENLAGIDKLVVNMEHGVDSVAYLFRPLRRNERLIIYHHGGAGGFVDGKEVIRAFVSKGYAVMAFSMPLCGMNSRPIVDLPRFGKMMMTAHGALELLKSEHLSPIKFFLEPVAVCLNYAERESDYSSIFMVGEDEGGWVTTLHAAIDERISRSYPVAGTLPVYLRAIAPYPPGTWGDYESTEPELLSVANYLELYVLGSYGEGRRQVQILNKYGSRFGGVNCRTYERAVRQRVAALGKGEFSIHLDEHPEEEGIHDGVMKVIIDDLERP